MNRSEKPPVAGQAKNMTSDYPDFRTTSARKFAPRQQVKPLGYRVDKSSVTLLKRGCYQKELPYFVQIHRQDLNFVNRPRSYCAYTDTLKPENETMQS
ncbi:hypothetical protein AVEN_118944-1, partial [Araneus ventricosus]